MLVDLFTLDGELESLFLEEYPEKFFPDEQFSIDTSDGKRIFCFYDLDYDKLKEFMSDYRFKYEFEIKNKKGEILEANLVYVFSSTFSNN